MTGNNPEDRTAPSAEEPAAVTGNNYIPLGAIIAALGAIILVPALLIIATAAPGTGAPSPTPKPLSSTIVQPPLVSGNPAIGLGLGDDERARAASTNDGLSKDEKQRAKESRKATATANAAAKNAADRATGQRAGTPATDESRRQAKAANDRNADKASVSEASTNPTPVP